MSADHKRPLYAFTIVALLCAFFVGNALRSEALVSVFRAAETTVAAAPGRGEAPIRDEAHGAQDEDPAPQAAGSSSAGAAQAPSTPQRVGEAAVVLPAAQGRTEGTKRVRPADAPSQGEEPRTVPDTVPDVVAGDTEPPAVARTPGARPFAWPGVGTPRSTAPRDTTTRAERADQRRQARAERREERRQAREERRKARQERAQKVREALTRPAATRSGKGTPRLDTPRRNAERATSGQRTSSRNVLREALRKAQESRSKARKAAAETKAGQAHRKAQHQHRHSRLRHR